LHYEAYPAMENFHFVLIKLLSLFTSDHALVINLFYLLTFPLTALTALYFFRHFKFSFGPAVVGSLLYAFLPYHFFRSLLPGAIDGSGARVGFFRTQS
jgi:phosphoglycerol transferase